MVRPHEETSLIRATTKDDDDAADERRRIARRTRGHVSSYGDSRVCAVDGCETALSRYNDSDVCSVHDETTRRPD